MAVTYSQNGVIVKPTGFDVIGGKKYKTVQMPDGKIWLAENLDFKFCNIGGAQGSAVPNAWYSDNNENTYGWNGYKCGLLYNWHAVNYLLTYPELYSGWHIPTKTEWENLITACGGASTAGQKLKALDGSAGANWPSGFNGTDDYGFKVLPTGGSLSDNTFFSVGTRGHFWTSTDTNASESNYIKFQNDTDEVFVGVDLKVYGYPIRLVRDAT